MYIIEDESVGFTSIPRSIYWAIVTLTTVGYGDIAPKTEIGQFIASIIMILGYGIIAVPTGIVTVAFNEVSKEGESNEKQQAPKIHLNTKNVQIVMLEIIRTQQSIVMPVVKAYGERKTRNCSRRTYSNKRRQWP